MRTNGKKMFPDKNTSNIFFLDNKNKVNINPNKYVNKNNNNKINPYLNNNNNNLKINIKSNNSINENRKKHKSLEYFNTNILDKNKNFIFNKENNNTVNRRKVLYTQRSVDILRTKRVLGNFSTRNYILNKSNIWERHKSFDNTNMSEEYQPLNTISAFSHDKNKYNDLSKKNQKIPSNNYYNKFINKSLLNEQNQNIKMRQHNKGKKIKKDKTIPPKEQTFIIKKINPDNNLIDTSELKKKFSENGVNVISLAGISNSLVPINNDSVKIVLNSNDINSKKFNKIEKYIKNKGLKLDEVKKNFNIKFTRGIYPDKSKWCDTTYGGRENFEKAELSNKFKKAQKEKKFHKKNFISKNNFYQDVKYKNNFEIKPKKYKSVEKK